MYGAGGACDPPVGSGAGSDPPVGSGVGSDPPVSAGVGSGWVGFTLGVGFSVGSFVAGASLGTTLGVSLPPPPPECLRSLDVLEFSFGVSALVVSKMVIVPSSATFTSKLLAGLGLRPPNDVPSFSNV